MYMSLGHVQVGPTVCHGGGVGQAKVEDLEASLLKYRLIIFI